MKLKDAGFWKKSYDEPRTYIQSEVSEKEKDKYHIQMHIYRI